MVSFLGEALGFALEAAIELFSGPRKTLQSADGGWARHKRQIWREICRQNKRDAVDAGRGATLLCNTCARELDVTADRLSANCGGDCWGCVGENEFGSGLTGKIHAEMASGLRNPDGSAKRRG